MPKSQLDAVQIIGQQLDKTAPVFSNVQNIMESSMSNGGTAVTYVTPIARDNIDGIVPVHCDEPNGVIFPIGTTIVTCTAQDMSGNLATATLRITVELSDVIPPVIVSPDDVTFEATGLITSVTPSQIGAATATDDTDSNVTITNDAPELFPLGYTTVTWTATDDVGNISTGTQSVILVDAVSPVFSDIINYTITGDGLRFPISYTVPTATDGIDGIIPVMCNPKNLTSIGENKIYCIAADNSGNSEKTSFVVTVPTDILFTLEPISTDSCEVRVHLGTTKTFSLESCDSEYAGVKYSSIPRSMYYGDVKISSDGLSLFITAPESTENHLHADEFGVTVDSTAFNQPRVDVSVVYYE